MELVNNSESAEKKGKGGDVGSRVEHVELWEKALTVGMLTLLPFDP